MSLNDRDMELWEFAVAVLPWLRGCRGRALTDKRRATLEALIAAAESLEEENRAECVSCGEESDDRCPASKRSCGHHCNHSWSHDVCDWCGKRWGGIDA